jgi:hypothetical protein
MGQEINRKTIVLAEPIKSLGIFKVAVKFPGGIEAQIKVWVTGIEEAKKSDAEIAELAAAEAEDDRDDDD